VSTTAVKGAPSLTRALCLLLALTGDGCSRQPDLDEVYQPPRARAAARSIAPVLAEFEITPGSALELSLGNRQRRVQGQVRLASGRLQLDPLDLAGTRGSMTFDLSTIQLGATPASDPPGDGATLTEQSLRWLELADAAHLAEHPQLRYARFSVQRVGGLSASSARGGQLLRSSAPDREVRRVQARASGELELHGFRLPYTLSLSATFSWDAAARPESPPSSIEIATTEPVSVDLIAHEILPRDGHGQVSAETLAELRKPPANQARVSARWLATLIGSNTPPDAPPP
jgi:hypothetical protein